MPDSSGMPVPSALADLLAALSPGPQSGGSGSALNALSPLTGLFAQPQRNTLAGLASSPASARRRSEWNDRFTHWERPASVREEGTLERAQTLVSDAIAGNTWLNAQRVSLAGQGSYFNNTNVWTEADIDLRVVHPNLKVEYHKNVLVDCARAAIGLIDAPLTYEQVFDGMRASLVADFNRSFGASNVRVGNKAIRIKGVTGSRAEVDVVPAVRYQWVSWMEGYSQYVTIEGVAILGRDGRWTINFPDQHSANGKAKRERTACRFKRIVRIFKRLSIETAGLGLLPAKVPSFMIESLVYAVEDAFFLVETDDRYGRVKRIARRMQELLANSSQAAKLTEVNGLNRLFGRGQAWTYADARQFADGVLAHLGNA